MSRVTVHDSTRSPPWAEGNGATVRVTSSSRARHIVVAKTRSRAESRAESHAKRAVFTLRAIDMNAEECERCLRAIRAHRPDMKQFLEPELEIDYARAHFFPSKPREIRRGESTLAQHCLLYTSPSPRD